MNEETKTMLKHEYAEACQKLAVKIISDSMALEIVDNKRMDIAENLMREFVRYTKATIEQFTFTDVKFGEPGDITIVERR